MKMSRVNKCIAFFFIITVICILHTHFQVISTVVDIFFKKHGSLPVIVSLRIDFHTKFYKLFFRKNYIDLANIVLCYYV